MAIRQIVLEGDDILRKKSREVTVFDKKLWTLLDDMKETMASADGVGLAAPQVGILRRVVIIDVGEGAVELINPIIIEKSKESLSEAEGCLSSPEEYGMVERPKYVKMIAQNRKGKPIELEGEGLLARAICHEVDHLEGILFKDLATEMVNIEQLKEE